MICGDGTGTTGEDARGRPACARVRNGRDAIVSRNSTCDIGELDAVLRRYCRRASTCHRAVIDCRGQVGSYHGDSGLLEACHRTIVKTHFSVAAIIPIAFCVSSILKVDHNVTETAHSQTPSRALSSPLISERSVTQPTVIPNRRNATQDSSPISPS